MSNPLKRKNIPWWIWASIAAALVVLVLPFRIQRTEYIHLVGAGAISLLRQVDSPERSSFRLRTERTEPVARTLSRVQKALEIRAKTVVIGLDTGELRTDDRSIDVARGVVREISRMAANSDSTVYMIGFAAMPGADPEELAAATVLNVWWMNEICTKGEIRCIEPPTYTDDPLEIRAALRVGIDRALHGYYLRPARPIPGELEPRS